MKINPDIINGNLTLAKNRAVWKKTKGKCCYCGVQTIKTYPDMAEHAKNPRAATIEHINPSSNGGTRVTKNLIVACRPCNTARGNKTLYEFRSEFGRDFYYKGFNIPITHCPSCKTILCMSIQPLRNDKGELRLKPLPKPFLCCPQVACRRVVNTETGEVYYRGKKENYLCLN